MVKIRLSASVSESTWHKIREYMRNSSSYTNKSDLIENAILKLVEGDKK